MIRRYEVHEQFSVTGPVYRRLTFKRAAELATELTRLTGRFWTVRKR